MKEIGKIKLYSTWYKLDSILNISCVKNKNMEGHSAPKHNKYYTSYAPVSISPCKHSHFSYICNVRSNLRSGNNSQNRFLEVHVGQHLASNETSYPLSL
jgi:hypothetical protein